VFRSANRERRKRTKSEKWIVPNARLLSGGGGPDACQTGGREAEDWFKNENSHPGKKGSARRRNRASRDRSRFNQPAKRGGRGNKKSFRKTAPRKTITRPHPMIPARKLLPTSKHREGQMSKREKQMNLGPAKGKQKKMAKRPECGETRTGGKVGEGQTRYGFS